MYEQQGMYKKPEESKTIRDWKAKNYNILRSLIYLFICLFIYLFIYLFIISNFPISQGIGIEEEEDEEMEDYNDEDRNKFDFFPDF